VERVFTVECYMKTESVAQTQRSFCTKFGNEHKAVLLHKTKSFFE
jgi:hypothetical protein